MQVIKVFKTYFGVNLEKILFKVVTVLVNCWSDMLLRFLCMLIFDFRNRICRHIYMILLTDLTVVLAHPSEMMA